MFLCRNTSGIKELPNLFAVKRTFVRDEESIAAQNEVDLLKTFQSPFVVALYESEAARANGTCCLSMALEYCPDSLARVLQKKHSAGDRLGTETIVRVIGCVAAALSYLHSRFPPIAHRDVKAENVLIGVDGIFKLCDFGSASCTAFVCRTGEQAAYAIEDIAKHTTTAYRSPEMADPWSGARIDERSDVWALGVLAYYCLYRRLPFEDTHLSILNGKLEFPSSPVSYPQELTDVVKRCLERDPSKRWRSFELLSHLVSLAESGVQAFAPISSLPIANLSDYNVKQAAGEVSEQEVFSPACNHAPLQKPEIQANLFSMLQWQSQEKPASASKDCRHPPVLPCTTSSHGPQPPDATPLTATRGNSSTSATAAPSQALDELFSWAPTPERRDEAQTHALSANDVFARCFEQKQDSRDPFHRLFPSS